MAYRRTKSQSSCSGCLTLLAVGATAVFLWSQFHLCWWVALLVVILGPAIIYAVFATLQEMLQERCTANKTNGED